jgi:prepilin-type N-terminal cleavage/methylation domain-containing protein
MQINNKSNTNSRGFSLIEMLVVIGVIGIMATSTVAIFTRFNQQQNITIAQKNLKNDLAEAKSSALSHIVTRCNTDPGNFPGVLIGYQVTFNVSARTYSLQEVCDLNSVAGPDQTPLTPAIKTKTLPNNINFVSAPQTSAYIRFYALSGGSSGGIVTITNAASTGNLIINVTADGVIQ